MKRPAGSIPQYATASRAVAGRQRFQGSVPLVQLTRLSPQLADRSGALDVDLEAGKDETGHPSLRGTIRGELTLMCQRGLHPFAWRCDLAPVLALVESETEEKKVLASGEPYLVENDRLPLRDLVEDEVLLALPMMPRCDDPDCLGRLGGGDPGAKSGD